MKKVTIYGAGAVGGNVAVRLASAGVADVSVVARGAHLAAIRERGLTLIHKDQRTTVRPVAATDNPADLPPQDLIIVTLKATSLPDAAPALAALRAPGAPVLFLINGIPWWWSHGLPAGHAASGVPLDLIDPNRALRDTLGADAALGGVIYSPNEVTAPGEITNKGHSRFLLGEPDGTRSPRLASTVDLFAAAGIEVSARTDLRRDIFGKLVLNVSVNPLCALTGLTARERLLEPGIRDLSRTLIHEVIAVSDASGFPVDPDLDIEALLDPERVPDARPSMLQDVLAGRPMEVDALLGQLQVLARYGEVATPALDGVLPLLQGLNRRVTQAG
ncbi:2-dehydropantoate 2-reductase [Pigmentiphaga litoralis]|uniref:ketopantoate reductase family protein n=1 Tax=Pigmentiphaga litoralis TaxID=516702 RepID=UPI00167952D6|nr:2-dehydropantoate 2-reductase [Pigmentiphaga litoralis]GGX31976.1 2-dehydropantoate 2-reductase [Pigmentiphaga litoralis]